MHTDRADGIDITPVLEPLEASPLLSAYDFGHAPDPMYPTLVDVKGGCV